MRFLVHSVHTRTSRKYFEQGSPWTFVVQNKVPHCCAINAKALVLDWLDAVVVQRLTRSTGWYGFIKTVQSDINECPDPFPPAKPIWCRGAKDSWGGANWSVSAATFNHRRNVPSAALPAGWLPTRRFADEWRSFVSQLEHPVTSLP
jgi:hypothetical protein